MTTHVTIPDVQRGLAAEIGVDYLTGREVREWAATYGIEPRTLRRYTRAGLVSAPERTGRGRSRGGEARYPSRVIFELWMIAEALKTTHNIPRIRHQLWWDGYPVEFEPWRAERLEELAGLGITELRRRGMSRARRDRMAVTLADEWARRRPFPLRGRALRTQARREQVAQWIVDSRYGGCQPDPTEDLVEGPDATGGDALDRAFMSELRAAGLVEPAPVGAQIAELLITVPTFSQIFEWLTELSERESRRLWRVARGLEDAGLFKSLRISALRDAPACAVLSLFYLQWAIPDAVIGELAAISPTAP